MIDYDHPNTFPKRFEKIAIEILKRLQDEICLNANEKWDEIKEKLCNFHIDEMEIVENFVQNHLDMEVAVCHCARILDANQYWNQGIITGGGNNGAGEKRLQDLLVGIGLDKEQIQKIFLSIYDLWNRDKELRTKSVHFFIDKDQVKDPRINYYAINLGGEILNWAIEEAIGQDSYKKEPYKRLWINGTPSVIKFKCKLKEISELRRNGMIAEIVLYFIAKRYGYSHSFDFTGMTIGNVPPENIISIEKIENYEQMQEKYAEFQGFYDE